MKTTRRKIAIAVFVFVAVICIVLAPTKHKHGRLGDIWGGGGGGSFEQVGAASLVSTSTPSGTQFLPFMGSSSGMLSSDVNAQGVAPRAITVTNLQVRLSSAEGASATISFTLNMCAPTSGACTGATQALTCTVGNSAKTCSDTTDSVSVPAGEFIDFTTVQSGTGSSSFIYVTYEIQ